MSERVIIDEQPSTQGALNRFDPTTLFAEHFRVYADEHAVQIRRLHPRLASDQRAGDLTALDSVRVRNFGSVEVLLI